MIIDERQQALDIINGDRLGGKDLWKDIYLLCKYWCSLGMNKLQIMDEITDVLERKYKNYNKVKMMDGLETTINKVTKHKKDMIIVEKISFTKPELDIIDSLPSSPLRKLAFVILYHAKLTKEKYQLDEDKDIWLNDGVNKYCNLAEIRVKKQDKLILMSKLQDLGLLKISQSLKEFMYKVNYIKTGKIVLYIDRIVDEKDILLSYMEYKGVKIKQCSECKRLMKIINTNSNVKYCQTCSKIIKNSQNKSYLLAKKQN